MSEIVALKYRGKAPNTSRSLMTKSPVDTKLATALTQAAADSSISSQLAPYATKSYVDTQDALNATQAYVDTQDNLRLKLSQKNVASGVPSLDATSKIARAKFNTTVTSTNSKPYATYSSIPSGVTTAAGANARSTITTISLASPGFNYRLLVWGCWETRATTDFCTPVISVRVGSSNGAIVGRGVGMNRQYYSATSYNIYCVTQIMPYNLSGQTILSGAQTLYVAVESTSSDTVEASGTGNAITTSAPKEFVSVIPFPA